MKKIVKKHYITIISFIFVLIVTTLFTVISKREVELDNNQTIVEQQDQTEQSSDNQNEIESISELELEPEPEPEPEPEIRDSQDRIANQSEQSELVQVNQNEEIPETTIKPDPKVTIETAPPLDLYAVTDVGPIDIDQSVYLDFEQPVLKSDELPEYINSELVYESFNLEPEELQSFSKELLDEILSDLPEVYFEEEVIVEILQTETEIDKAPLEETEKQLVIAEIPPSLNIISPANNSFFRSQVFIEFQVFNDSSGNGFERVQKVYWVSSDGIENVLDATDSNSYSFEYSTIGHEGNLNIKVVALKDNGLIDEKILTLKEDRKGPSITITSPEENSEADDSVIIKGTLYTSETEFVGIDEIASLSIKINEDLDFLDIPFDENGNFEIAIDSSSFDGLNLIQFAAIDKNNHESVLNFPILGKERIVIEDILPPHIVLISPENNSNYNSKINISGKALNDLDSNESDQITEFYWTMAGKSQKNNIELSRRGQFEFQISTVDINSDLDIVFTAMKEGEVKKELLLSLVNDNQGPEIILESPQNDQYFSNSIKVAGQVLDMVGRNNEVKSLYWSVSSDPENENLIFFEDDGSFDFEINTEYINGLVSFQLSAFDLNNNPSTFSVELKDGKKPPVILVETPESGSKYGAGISIKGKISDPYSWNNEFGGIESITALIVPADVVSTGESTEVDLPVNENGVFDYIFRTDQRTGEQNLLIKVVARNGNTSEETIEINEGEFPISDFTVDQGNKRLILDWTTLPFISNYYIKYTSDGSDPTTQSTLSLDDVQPPLVLTNLENGSLYSFLLTGETDEGAVRSDVIKSIPLAEDTLEPYAKSEFGFIEISWIAIKGSESYRVLRSENNSDFIDISDEITGNRFLDRSGIFGKEYQYKVIPSDFYAIESYAITGELLSEPPLRLTQKGLLNNLKPDAIKIDGDYAYVVSEEEGLYIVDISDPAQLSIRGFILLEGAKDLTVWEDYVVAASGENGFSIINISEPASPRLIGSRKTTDASAVFVEDNYVYLADGVKGLKIYSLREPKRPPRVYFNDDFSAYDVTAVNGFLYVSSGSEGLNIFDIEDPEYPEYVGGIDNINILDSEIVGNYCYSASGDEGFNILDISNPAEPFLCSNYQTLNAQSVTLKDNHAMIADGEGGLIDIDITDPYRPESFETMDLAFSTSVDVNDNIVLVADRTGLFSIESFQHGQSFKVGELVTEGDAHSATAVGDLLYISDHSNGFLVLDISNPVEISNRDVLFQLQSDYAEDIIVDDNSLYLADGSGGIKIYNIYDGVAELSETIEISGDAKNLVLTEHYILSASGRGGIQGKRRISLDNAPLEATDESIGKYQADLSILFPDARDLVFYDDYLFVTDRKRGLIVIDFTNPELSRTIIEIPLSGAISVDQFENRLYVAHAEGVSIFDITDKNYPDELTRIETPYAEDIKIDQDILYIAEGHIGLSVYDVKDHNKILKVSVCEDVFADSVTVSKGYAYIADSTGINVVKIYIPQWIKQRN